MVQNGVPQAASEAVFTASEALGADVPVVKGHDFNDGCDIDSVMGAMLTTGFQATCLGQAAREIDRMLSWRLSDEPMTEEELQEQRAAQPTTTAVPTAAAASTTAAPTVASATPAALAAAAAGDGPAAGPAAASAPGQRREDVGAKIFLGYTSNLVSAGTREQLRWLVEHRMVDVLVTTAGGIEEDFIKCMAHTYLGDFALKGADLRKRGLNRIGNMLVPNSNYCKFEDWLMPILDAMLAEQQAGGVAWTPSKMIARLGREINCPTSIYYWAQKNGIPVYCPALTDGSIGDMLYFHSYRSPGLVIDLVADIRGMNDEAVRAAPRKTGMIILGGGVAKHHTCNANLMRNGADFAVLLNTAQEFDGSDSGAKPDEAVSWGKIKADAEPVKVCGDATILFPLLLSQTFVKHWRKQQQRSQQRQEAQQEA